MRLFAVALLLLCARPALCVPEAASAPSVSPVRGLDERLAVFLQRSAGLSTSGPGPQAAAASPAEAAHALAAVKKELSRYEPDQLASMPAEDVERLAGRVMDGLGRERPEPAAASRAADLPPAGPAGGLDDAGLILALTPPKERPPIFPETGMLGKILLTPDPGLGPVADEALRRERNLSRTLFDLFASLRGVVEGPGAAAARAATALALRDKLAAFLRAVRSPGRSPPYRAVAGRALHRMLLSGALIEELFNVRAARGKARELRAALDAAPVPPKLRERLARSRPESSSDWRIPRRLPESERVSGPGEPEVLYTSPRELSERAADDLFRLERQSRRVALTRDDPRFSEAFRRKQARRLTRAYLSAERYRRWLDDALDAYAGNRLLNQFINPPRGPAAWKPLHLPENPNLSLTLGEDGLVLRATLTTDIQEPELAAYAKASIEDYWRGSVSDAEGHVIPFRAELTVRRLAPGEPFAAADLRLVETAGHGDYGTRLGIGVSRRNMAWGTIAHEFGHVLGLPDEYQVEYDARGRRVKQTSFPGSLMSDSSRGVVQARHFANVFNLFAAAGRLVVEEPAAAQAGTR